MTELDETNYASGQDAFERGEAQAACPYAFPGWRRSFWLAGWDEARRLRRALVGEAGLWP
jgi:ribosome modulation factor